MVTLVPAPPCQPRTIPVGATGTARGSAAPPRAMTLPALPDCSARCLGPQGASAHRSSRCSGAVEVAPDEWLPDGERLQEHRDKSVEVLASRGRPADEVHVGPYGGLRVTRSPGDRCLRSARRTHGHGLIPGAVVAIGRRCHRPADILRSWSQEAPPPGRSRARPACRSSCRVMRPPAHAPRLSVATRCCSAQRLSHTLSICFPVHR